MSASSFLLFKLPRMAPKAASGAPRKQREGRGINWEGEEGRNWPLLHLALGSTWLPKKPWEMPFSAALRGESGGTCRLQPPHPTTASPRGALTLLNFQFCR